MARGEGRIIRGYWASSLFLGRVVLFLGDVVLFLGNVFIGDANLLLEVDR